MRIEWKGQPELAEMLPAGTVCLYHHREQTHLAIRGDDETRGLKVKGLISLSAGYDAPPRRPAFFDLSILGATRVVYALPLAAIALPTDRNRIHPGRYGIANPVPGALTQLGDRFFLGVAYNAGLQFLDLTS